LGGLEHGLGFADAGGHAEKNGQPAAGPGAVRIIDGRRPRSGFRRKRISHAKEH